MQRRDSKTMPGKIGQELFDMTKEERLEHLQEGRIDLNACDSDTLEELKTLDDRARSRGVHEIPAPKVIDTRTSSIV